MNASHRFHALDATRAFALLLGVGLHSAMSFFLPIPAQDASQSTALAVTFYTIHVFRMGLFFAIAGFFARMLLHRRGTRGFVADRARRIGVPMIAGWLLLAPPTIALVSCPSTWILAGNGVRSSGRANDNRAMPTA